MSMMMVMRPKRSQPRPPGGILRHSYPVGRYTVTWTFDLGTMALGAVGQNNVQWSPDAPPKGSLTEADFRQYRKGRDAIYQEIADISGGNILVAEL